MKFRERRNFGTHSRVSIEVKNKVIKEINTRCFYGYRSLVLRAIGPTGPEAGMCNDLVNNSLYHPYAQIIETYNLES